MGHYFHIFYIAGRLLNQTKSHQTVCEYVLLSMASIYLVTLSLHTIVVHVMVTTYLSLAEEATESKGGHCAKLK